MYHPHSQPTVVKVTIIVECINSSITCNNQILWASWICGLLVSDIILGKFSVIVAPFITPVHFSFSSSDIFIMHNFVIVPQFLDVLFYFLQCSLIFASVGLYSLSVFVCYLLFPLKPFHINFLKKILGLVLIPLLCLCLIIMLVWCFQTMLFTFNMLYNILL